METPKDKIKMIMERLGMSGMVAARAMHMPEGTFRKKIMPSLPLLTFTEKNHVDLVDFLIDEIQFLAIHKKANNVDVNAFEYVADKIKDIYKNYSNYRKLEDWNLFDELKSVIDFMETSEVFNDIKLYTSIIDGVVFESALLKKEPNAFTIKMYNDYAHGDKKNSHSRWFDYMSYRRQQTIMDILKED